jgi:ligand-binding sensor domain-containing protein
LSTSGAHVEQSETSPFALSQYAVYCILKDTKGNVWFGTQAHGVCRFDGKSFTWFKEKGLAGPAVLALYEDSKGNLWFGNNGAGLFRYDGKTLTNFTHEKGLDNADFRLLGKSGIGTVARVYAIQEDNSGNLWVGTVDAGVWKYDGTKLTNYTTADGLTSNAVNTIYKDKNGELWFGTDSDGICKFDGKRFVKWGI